MCHFNLFTFCSGGTMDEPRVLGMLGKHPATKIHKLLLFETGARAHYVGWT